MDFWFQVVDIFLCGFLVFLFTFFRGQLCSGRACVGVSVNCCSNVCDFSYFHGRMAGIKFRSRKDGLPRRSASLLTAESSDGLVFDVSVFRVGKRACWSGFVFATCGKWWGELSEIFFLWDPAEPFGVRWELRPGRLLVDGREECS